MTLSCKKEIKGLLGWLEGYAGARVDDLSTKTKVQSYYEHDYEDFLGILKKNTKARNRSFSTGSRARRCDPLTALAFGVLHTLITHQEINSNKLKRASTRRDENARINWLASADL